VTAACDNKGVLTRTAKHTSGIRLCHHKEAEADLLLTLREWATKNPYKFKLRWVKGHQDEVTKEVDLSPLARLNIEMDAMADSVHAPTFPSKSTAEQEVLPAERWALFIDSEKVTTKLKDRVIHRCHHIALECYVAAKHNLSECVA